MLTMLAYRGDTQVAEYPVDTHGDQSKQIYAEIATKLRTRLDFSRVVLINEFNEIVADTNGMG